MFLLDGQDRLAFVTGPLAEWLGHESTALSDRSLWEFVDEDDRPGLQRTIRAVREDDTTTAQVCQCWMRTTRGRFRVGIEFVAAAQPKAFGDVLGFVRQSESAGRHAALETARDRFGHLFDLVQDAVVEIEIDDRGPLVRSVNPAFEEVFGYDAEAVLGESLNDFVVPEGKENRAEDFDRRTAEGQINHAVVTRETACGPREFLYRGIPYDREDGTRYGFAIYSDITTQKRIQQHLQVLHRVLRHNLRNDLTVILGMAEEIERASDDPRVESAVSTLLENAEALVNLSESSQTAASILARLSDNDHRAIDVVDEIRTVVRAARLEWPAVSIETDLPESLSVRTDPAFRTAITNLVENAVVHNETPTVRVGATARDEAGVVYVADDGDGIPAAEEAAVFGDADITQLRHSTGLGLWLVKWIGEATGGRLEYERSGGWTVLTLELPPATDVTETGVHPEITPPNRPSGRRSRRRRR